MAQQVRELGSSRCPACQMIRACVVRAQPWLPQAIASSQLVFEVEDLALRTGRFLKLILAPMRRSLAQPAGLAAPNGPPLRFCHALHRKRLLQQVLGSIIDLKACFALPMGESLMFGLPTIGIRYQWRCG